MTVYVISRLDGEVISVIEHVKYWAEDFYETADANGHSKIYVSDNEYVTDNGGTAKEFAADEG